MSDEIKPVPPVHNVPSNLPQRLMDAIKLQQRTAPASPVKPASEGYDLSAITPQQAQQLLATPLMQDEKANANPNIQGLKTALEHRAANQPMEQGDMPALVTASVRVASLVSDTYSAPKPGQKMAAPTTSEQRAKITDFDTLATSFGKERQVMRG